LCEPSDVRRPLPAESGRSKLFVGEASTFSGVIDPMRSRSLSSAALAEAEKARAAASFHVMHTILAHPAR
jgi:hypothetical protein